MNLWLQNFAYSIKISISNFIIAGIIALVIAIVTISYQSLKAANANPVNALKHE